MRIVIAALVVWILLFGITGLSVGWGVMTGISCGFTAIVLLLTMLASETGGWAMVWALFVLYGIIGTLNIVLEGLFFHIFPLSVGLSVLATGLVTAFTVSAAMVLVAGRFSPAEEAKLNASWPLRLPILGLTYVILFFVAGSLVFPYVQHFYANREMPLMGVIVGVEFLRGILYGAAMVPAARLMAGHRSRAAGILGLCLAIFGGVAPLLLPDNKYLPADILPYHLVEVGCENFLLGAIGAWLFVAKAKDTRPRYVADHGIAGRREMAL
jgi:hypothetical protein